ncbi:MAG TPA: hypothetical protein VL996_09210 [Methylocella sp.]|nr:hypothetical protein [Methylocella sp.]
MKPGVIGLTLFVLGSAALIVFSPLYSPDLELVPPGPITLPRFALFYYIPRLILSAILVISASYIIFTEDYSKPDKYWASGTIGALVVSWAIWLKS